jgi:hypothetical protein
MRVNFFDIAGSVAVLFSFSYPPSILVAFKPGTVEAVRLTGLHRLYRAAGWDATKKERQTHIWLLKYG